MTDAQSIGQLAYTPEPLFIWAIKNIKIFEFITPPYYTGEPQERLCLSWFAVMTHSVSNLGEPATVPTVCSHLTKFKRSLAGLMYLSDENSSRT